MLYLATLDTPNFRFSALGTTEQEARELLRRGFIEPFPQGARREYRAEVFERYADGVNVYSVADGYRSGVGDLYGMTYFPEPA